MSSDRSLEQRIQRRLVMETVNFHLEGYGEGPGGRQMDGSYVLLADAARVAALEAQDSFREVILAKATEWEQRGAPVMRFYAAELRAMVEDPK